MDKICFVTDTHLGARGASNVFRDYFKWFWKDHFFPTVKKQGVKAIFHGGDFFDNRNNINAKDVDFLINFFIPLVNEYEIPFHMILGNHDIHYKNRNDLTIASLFENNEYIKTYDRPIDISISNLPDILLIPWINKENYDECIHKIETSDADICLGHFCLDGFKMYRTSVSTSGLSPKIFKNFPLVLSGHYHHASKVGNIQYLGSPYHMNWQDYPDERGIYIYEDGDMEFIETPATLFNEFEYEPEKEYNFDDFSDQFIKVIVNEKPDKLKYNEFANNLKQSKAFRVDIIDKTILSAKSKKVSTKKTESQSTLDIMFDYFDDSIENKSVVKKLKPLSEKIYKKALDEMIIGD